MISIRLVGVATGTLRLTAAILGMLQLCLAVLLR